MFKKITTSIALVSALLLIGATSVSAGSLTPPGAPARTMYTMTDIFNLSAGTTATLGSGTIPTTPASVAASFKTLTEIYDAIATQIAILSNPKIANGITAFGFTGTLFGDTNAAKVLANATYPGTIAVKTADNAVTGGTVSGTSLLITPPLGYYDGTATVSTTSPYFIAGNIKSGVNLFGIAGSLVANLYGDLTDATKVLTTASSPGTYNAANLSAGTVLAGTTFGVGLTGAVIQSLGNAIAANVLSTATFSNAAGANISGTMPTNTLSSANDTVAAGYYAATTLSAVDTNLAAGNIKSGTTIFGKVGTYVGAQLITTNQTICSNASGSVIACAGTGQDGELQKGVARSFTDNGTSPGTITDNNTGLVWQKQDDATTRTWTAALAYCNSNTAALPGTGWRLPNVYELYSLVDFGVATAPFTNGTYFPATAGNNYWSSTTFPDVYSFAVGVNFSSSNSNVNGKANSYYVRCVRR